VKRFFNKHLNVRSLVKIVAVILLVIIMVGGTFAWRDYNQHRTNIATGEPVRYNVTLNDEFLPRTNWNVAQSDLPKQISVTYPMPLNMLQADVDDLYDDVFVRLRLWEFFGMREAEFSLSEHRYMTYSTHGDSALIGRFIKIEVVGDGDNEVAARTAFEGILDDLGYSADFINDFDMDRLFYYHCGDELEYWFIRTEFGFPDVADGQIGKHVPVGLEPPAEGAPRLWQTLQADPTHVPDGRLPIGWQVGNGIPIIDLPELHDARYTEEVISQWGRYHTATPWVRLDWTAGVLDTNPIRQYVDLIFNTGDILFLSDIVGGDPWPAEGDGKWIIDDVSPDGWIYWSEALRPGVSTEALLNSLNLLEQPAGEFIYSVHVDMQAVAYHTLWEHTGNNATSETYGQAHKEIIDQLQFPRLVEELYDLFDFVADTIFNEPFISRPDYEDIMLELDPLVGEIFAAWPDFTDVDDVRRFISEIRRIFGAAGIPIVIPPPSAGISAFSEPIDPFEALYNRFIEARR
jgi:hypothetical protein